MKIQMKGKIERAARSEPGEGTVTIELPVAGMVVDQSGTDAKKADAEVKFTVKWVVADKLRLGDPIYVTISTDEPGP